jgi:hypothetical protein
MLVYINDYKHNAHNNTITFLKTTKIFFGDQLYAWEDFCTTNKYSPPLSFLMDFSPTLIL